MKYQVWLKGMSKMVLVTAEDVDLNGYEEGSGRPGNTAYWNFTDGDFTVAAFPRENVEYIVSEG